MNRKKLVKFLSITLSIVLSLSLLAACATNDDDKAREDNEPATSDEEVGDKVVVTIGQFTELTNLDRFANYGPGGDDTGLLWADPLVYSDHKQNYTPALALEWSASEDYLSYTFKLREGVKFQDGSDFTSFDVKRTFERMFEDETLVDVNAWQPFESVETPDDYTAIIHLESVMPTFYDEIGRVPIISGAAYDADPAGYFLSPVGTGAYTVASFDNLTSLVKFARNDDWWGWGEVGDSNVDEIVYELISDTTTRVSALQAGDIDIAFQLPLDNLQLLDKEKFTVTEVKADSHIHLAFQCAEDRPFSNKDLREALSLSIDRQALVDNILGGGTASTWAVPEGNLGYISGQGYEYDVERAKELVTKSGYAGEEIKLLINPNITGYSEVCQAIQSMATQANINIVLDPVEYATFVDRRDAGDFDVFFGSFSATCGDPQVEAGVIIAFNVFNTNYENPQLAELTGAVGGLSDKEERAKTLEQIFTIEMEEFAPFIYVYDESYCFASSSNVSGYVTFADGAGDYRFINVTDN
jgi:peptide/nickel transport system substrate-binding protein